MPSARYHVLAKEGFARCLPFGSEESAALGEAGWETLWDDAPSVAAGLVHAARSHGALPADHDERMQPRPMASARVLYRSVSPAELEDIAARGEILGRLNTFNPFDSRRLVFFGDAITERLTWQGDEVDRAVDATFASHPMHREFEEIEAQRKKGHASMMAGVRKLVAKEEANRRREGRRRSNVDARCLGDAEAGSVPSLQSLYRNLPHTASLDRLSESLRELDRRQSELTAAFKSAFKAACREERARRADYPYTSAILETQPLAHGFHYSAAHGRSGMGQEDEYGFLSGSVTREDIVRIHLVHEGKVTEILDADALEETVARFREPARGPRP